MIDEEQLANMQEGDWCTTNLRGMLENYAEFEDFPVGEKTIFDVDYGTMSVGRSEIGWYLTFSNEKGMSDFAHQDSGEHAPQAYFGYVDWDNDAVYLDCWHPIDSRYERVKFSVKDALAAICLRDSYEWHLNII